MTLVTADSREKILHVRTGRWLPWSQAVVVACVLALVQACGGSTPSAQATPTPSPAPTPLTCTAGGPASASWPTPDTRTSTTPPIVSASVSGDTLTLTFDQGTPLFEVTPQPSAHFTATTGQGAPVDLAGSAGVLIILRGFRGDMQNYTGPTSITSQGPLLLEARAIGEFEGVVGWGAGLSKPGCANVAASASTLTFRFIPTAP
jgi:hypothetical protein